MGCKKKVETSPLDEEVPTISMTSPEVLPAGSYTNFTSGQKVPFDIRFEDDKALKNYEININWQPSQLYEKTNNFPWERKIVGLLSGKVGGFNDSIAVPYDPSAGPYVISIAVWDSAGNRTDLSTSIFVSNSLDTNLPTITVTTPTTAVDTYLIGQDIIINATLSDDNLVEDAFLRVRNAFTNEVMPGSEIPYDTIWAFSPYVVDTFVTIPAGTAPGDYNVEIFANDYIQNIAKETVPIYIKN